MQEKSGKNKIYENAIKNWPKDERPREKLFKAGEHTLRNAELLAVLLRSGVKGQSAIDFSRKILSKFKERKKRIVKPRYEVIRRYGCRLFCRFRKPLIFQAFLPYVPPQKIKN